MKKLTILFLLAIFTFLACDKTSAPEKEGTATEGSTNQSQPSQSTKNPDPAPESNIQSRNLRVPDAEFICIPGKRVGQITTSSDEEQIIELYGQENVKREEIGIGEGSSVPGTIVFPDNEKQLVIYWEKEAPFEKIAKIRIDRRGAPWRTSSGIKIGTTIEELQKINGKEFFFYGFEWDYSGLVNDWSNGNISELLNVSLIADNPEAVLPDLIGEKLYSSEHPKAAEGDLTVGSMMFLFSQAPVQ